MATKHYLVQWEMEIDADSARDAAQQAWEYMRALGSTANVFYVTNDSGDTERVDLGESPDTAARARTRDTTPRARKSKHLWEQRHRERARAASRERTRRYVERHGEAYKARKAEYMREYMCEYMRRKRAAEKRGDDPSRRSNANHAKYRND